MSIPNRMDIRQTETRVLQDQLNVIATAGLDSTLASANSELTPVLRLQANNPSTLVINVQNSVIENPNTSVNRSIGPISGVVPSFSSGTITFPSADGGNITASTGGSTVLNCPTGQYVKVIIALDNSGNLLTVCGTPNASSSAAQVPPPPLIALPIGYALIQNISGTIQNIVNSRIYQFPGSSGSAASPSSTFIGSSYYLNTNIISYVSSSTIVFDTALYDTNSAYNTSTGVYTASTTGRYAVSVTLGTRVSVSSNGSTEQGGRIVVNKSMIGEIDYNISTNTPYQLSSDGQSLFGYSGSIILSLNAGDMVTFEAFIGGNSVSISTHDVLGTNGVERSSYFSIQFLG